MSLIIKTSSEDVILNSIALNEQFYLTLVKCKQDNLESKYYNYREYESLLKNLWNNYLYKNEKPKLLNYLITDKGLIDETLHFIKHFYENNHIITDLLYSVYKEFGIISHKMGYQDATYLINNLDTIIKTEMNK